MIILFTQFYISTCDPQLQRHFIFFNTEKHFEMENDDWESVSAPNGTGNYWWNKTTNETTEVGAPKPTKAKIALVAVAKNEDTQKFGQSNPMLGKAEPQVGGGKSFFGKLTEKLSESLTPERLDPTVRANKSDLRSETEIREKKRQVSFSLKYSTDF